MSKRFLLALGAASLMIAAAFAGMSIAGGSNDPDARNVTVLQAETAVPRAPGAAARPASERKGRKPAIQTFYARNRLVPAEQAGSVIPLKCPKGKGSPVSGGAATDVGIVTSYLSHIKPGALKTKARTYYVGVDDNSTTNTAAAGAIIEIQCAKNIAVKY